MASRKIALLIAAFLATTSLPAFAGGGSGSGGSGSSGVSAGQTAGAPQGAVVAQPSAPPRQDPITQGVPPAASADGALNHGQTVGQAGSGIHQGVGTSANGLPIGTSGSGPGSPEQPIDSGTR
jgi:hypothetical protein